jgi:hypothetical protein
MKKIYICSPLSAPTHEEVKANINRARRYCRKIALDGNLPYAPHTYFTEFLIDDLQDEREIGMKMGIAWLDECEEIHILPGFISEGMSKEIVHAVNVNIKVVAITEAEEAAWTKSAKQ